MDESYLRDYEAFETRHWWFTVRRQIISRQIDTFLPNPIAETRWLDVGCGSGVFLESYKAIVEKMGVEIAPQNVARAQEKGLNVLPVTKAWDFADFGKFDLITLCDVVEHVDNESPAIDAVHKALKPKGIVLVTVPAMRSLWGAHDVMNHHFRRYSRRSLEALFEPGRWEILRTTYFSSLLLPMIWTARKWKNLRGNDNGHDVFFGPKIVDGMLHRIFSIERPLLNVMSFPLGSSLLLVAKKRA